MSDIDTIREALQWIISKSRSLGEYHSTLDPETAHGLIVEIPHECNEALAALDRLQAQQPNAEPVDMIHNDYDASVKCSNCGTDGGFGVYDDLDWAKFCPGCGRPIARQIDAKGNVTPHPLYAHPPASTEPRLTVEQAMEVVEPFIDAEAEMEDGARWNWESKHKKYREMIEEIRDRLTKAAKP